MKPFFLLSFLPSSLSSLQMLRHHFLPSQLRVLESLGSLCLRSFTTHEIRTKYIEYFNRKNHRLLPGCPLIPPNDNSLLFTNSGMVQFKDCFLGKTAPPHPLVVTVQNCMRAGGKHNDLDNVGFTPRHHTFFEMLGNFAFGTSFKQETITMAWEFLTKDLQIDPIRLRVTVFETDEEAFAIWRDKIGVPVEKIIRLGAQDNFWSMGDGEGPCGPCTEIFYDTRSDDPENRWIEIWNLVFMENMRQADGSLGVLPVKCVDTGMGLERVAAVLQGKTNTFDCNAFQPLTKSVVQTLLSQTGIAAAQENPKVRIIADHFRAAAFLIADGVVPGNVGRSYVLRRILRRAIRAGKDLGFKEPFLGNLFPALHESIDPNSARRLGQKESYIRSTLEAEEVSFLSTLERGYKLLEEAVGKARSCSNSTEKPLITAAVAFQLSDTYGFPLDLTEMICNERGLRVDLAGAEKLMEEQRARSKGLVDKNAQHKETKDWERDNIRPVFIREKAADGIRATIQGVIPWTQPNHFLVAMNPSPFYARGGGQIGDSGRLQFEDGSILSVVDTIRPYDHGNALVVQANPQSTNEHPLLAVGTGVTALVDYKRREKIEAHHSATHLLHAALRTLLGTHISQAGSLVEEDRLRFDFSHHSPLSRDQIAAVETWVQEAISADVELVSKEMPKDEAISLGAMAMFGEKYGEVVRTVRIPRYSLELCGGTHVGHTGRLYPFKILSESSIATGIRRIEATAGQATVEFLSEKFTALERVSSILKATPNDVEAKLKRSLEQQGEIQRTLNQVSGILAQAEQLPSGEQITYSTQPGPQGLSVVIHELKDHWQDDFLLKRINFLKQLNPQEIHLVISGTKLLCGTHDAAPQLNAGKVASSLLKTLGGKGGGGKEVGRGQISPRNPGESLEGKIATWASTELGALLVPKK